MKTKIIILGLIAFNLCFSKELLEWKDWKGKDLLIYHQKALEKLKEIDTMEVIIEKKLEELEKDDIAGMYWEKEKKTMYLELVKRKTELENLENSIYSEYNAIIRINHE